MKTFAPLVLAAGLAQAAYLVPRAVDCGTMMATVNAANNGLARATAFCTAHLGLVPKTTTATQVVLRTQRVTQRTTTTTTSLVTPAVSTKNKGKTTTTVTTDTPPAVTETNYVTSTAYLDPDGNTLALMKRAEPTPLAEEEDELEKRATKAAKPEFYNGLGKNDLRAACLCLNLQPRTITRNVKATSTTTLTTQTSRTIKKVAVVATPLTTVTTTATRVLTVLAAAPVIPETVVVIEETYACPPGTDTTFECPTGTGNDDLTGTEAGHLACPVVTADEYHGYCKYWDDDGSPVGTTLENDGDGSERDATYGDDDTDDCPSWSDFQCTSSGGGRRRWFQERALSPTSTGTSLTRQRKTMPQGLKRGGKRVYH